jgi:hypothetical protein
MAHEGSYASFADLGKARTILIGKDGQFSFWQWLKSGHGLRDEQLKPYTFNLAPFLQDKMLVQQGYASSEPFSAIERGRGRRSFCWRPRLEHLQHHGRDARGADPDTAARQVQKSSMPRSSAGTTSCTGTGKRRTR